VNEYNIDWSSGQVPDFKFNGKELDEESGMYYFEARYHAPPSFISRDVLFEEKPWMSPYAYCRNNPLNMIDPSGEDEYEINKQGEVKWVKESDKHTLFAVGKDGKRTGASITVKNKQILDDLTKGSPRVKMDAEGTITDRGTHSETEIGESGKNDIFNVFKFAADNSNVEWGLYAEKEKGTIKYKLATDGFNDISPAKVNNPNNIIFAVHSHPLEKTTKAEQESLYGDKNMGYKYTMHVYMPHSKNLYKVGNSITAVGKINKYTDFFNFIKKMKYLLHSFWLLLLFQSHTVSCQIDSKIAMCINTYIKQHDAFFSHISTPVYYVLFFKKEDRQFFMVWIGINSKYMQQPNKYKFLTQKYQNRFVFFTFKKKSPSEFIGIKKEYFITQKKLPDIQNDYVYDGSWYPETYECFLQEGTISHIQYIDTLYQEALGTDFINFEKLFYTDTNGYRKKK
jgi:RHS repeat-associated protein